MENVQNAFNTLGGFFTSDFFTRDIEFNFETLMNVLMVLLFGSLALGLLAFGGFLIYAVVTILCSGFGIGAVMFGIVVFGGISAALAHGY